MELIANILGMWTPGPLELIVILIVAVLIFGRRLPEIARSMGKSLTEFKKGLSETKKDIEKSCEIDDNSSDDEQKANENSN